MAAVDELTVNGCDNYYEFSCTICAEKGGNVEALKRCEECAENLCGPCLENHNMFKAMRGHTLVEVGTIGHMKPGDGRSVPAQPNVKCRRHPANNVELYCADHDVVGCYTCTKLHHKECGDMYDIPEAAIGFKNTDEPNAVVESFDGLIQRTKLLKQAEESNLLRIAQEERASIGLINERATLIKEMVDNLKENAITEVKVNVKEREQAVAESITKADDIINQLAAEEKHLKSVIHSNESDVFIYAKQGKKMSNENEQLVQGLEKSATNSTPIEISVDETILARVTELQTLARVKPESDSLSKKMEELKIGSGKSLIGLQENAPERKSLSVQSRQKPIIATSTVNSHEASKSDILSFSLEKSQSIFTKADRNACTITDCCVLKNGNLVMTDEANACLKLFDQSYKSLHRRALQDEPWAGCLVGEQEIAVALADCSVQFATVDKTIKLTRFFEVDEAGRGISYASQKLYISCGGRRSDNEGPGQVSVYDMDGTLLQIFKPSNPVRHRLGIPHGITATTNGHFIVANNRKGVLAFDKSGKVIWHCQNDLLKHAAGVCEVDDKVLVCCMNTGNIFEISQAGQKSRELIHVPVSPIQSAPMSLSYNKYNDRLIVTMDEADHILVYRRH